MAITAAATAPAPTCGGAMFAGGGKATPPSPRPPPAPRGDAIVPRDFHESHGVRGTRILGVRSRWEEVGTVPPPHGVMMIPSRRELAAVLAVGPSAASIHAKHDSIG